jgi:hypothetical protein
MTKVKNVHWGRWVGSIACGLIVLKSTAFVTGKAFGVARSEVQARGGDVAFVLGLVKRQRSTRGG